MSFDTHEELISNTSKSHLLKRLGTRSSHSCWVQHRLTEEDPTGRSWSSCHTIHLNPRGMKNTST